MSNCCDRFVMIEGEEDSFETWQGLRGPYYTPSVSEDGTLSWTNNGDLQNPANVNIIGPPGEQGPAGDPGPGVAEGGTTGQLLAKASDEDYDTEWIDQPEMDAGHVSYDSTETYDDGTVGKELGTINSALSSLSAVTEIIDTASGAIASFPDGAGLPMRSLLAQIEPQQDLHGYDAPWAAGAGANKLRTPYTDGASKTGSNVTYTVNSAGQITIACSASASGNLDYYLFGGAGSTYESTGLESGTYTFAVFVPSATTGLQMFAIDEDGTSLCGKNVGSGASQTFSIDSTKKYRMFLRVQSGNTVNTVASPTIVSGSTAPTAWTPYANECPITGWTGLSGQRDGKNLLDRSNPDRPNSLVATDGTISGNNNFDTWYFKHVGEFAISLTVTEANNNGRIVVMNADGTKDTTVTLPTTIGRGSATFSLADGQTAYISIRKSATDCQIETGSTASTYEAYTSLPITCTWQDEAGTVYGGTVDVVSGVLTFEKVIETKKWSEALSDGTNLGSVTRRVFPLQNACVDNDPTDISNIAIRNGSYTLDSTHFYINATNNRAYVFLPNGTSGDTEIQLCYSLAQPQTYQLTPQQISTLLGNNTVFVDCGSVSVTYQASIKGYIDKVLGA